MLDIHICGQIVQFLLEQYKVWCRFVLGIETVEFAVILPAVSNRRDYSKEICYQKINNYITLSLKLTFDFHNF